MCDFEVTLCGFVIKFGFVVFTLCGSVIMLGGFHITLCGFGIKLRFFGFVTKLRYVVLELNYVMWF